MLGAGGLGRLLELGVHGDRDPDLATEAHRQRVLELGAQAALELVAGEVVGDRDDGGALVEGDRLTGAQPGALVGLEVVDHAAPGDSEVRGALVHRSRFLRRSRFAADPFRRGPGPHRRRRPAVPQENRRPRGRRSVSTTLSTGCEPGAPAVESLRPRSSRRRRGSTSVQVSGGYSLMWRASHDLLVRWATRMTGNLGALEPNSPPRAAASRHPQVRPAVGRPVPEVVRAGLTLWIASAYRYSVTRCRPVPHVHERAVARRGRFAGGRCQPKGASRVRSTAPHCRSGPA